jgi:polyphosphate kinase
VIPFRHAQCLEGTRQIIWETNQIISKENLDDKIKIQCLTLLTNVHRAIAEMTADGAIVEQAIKEVKQLQQQSQQEQQQQQQQQQQQTDIAAETEEAIEEEYTTTNGVF